jgi:hypothetical protein
LLLSVRSSGLMLEIAFSLTRAERSRGMAWYSGDEVVVVCRCGDEPDEIDSRVIEGIDMCRDDG